MNVLGIAGNRRDAAAALAVDGRIVAAVAEESFARVSGIGYDQTGGFPSAAARSCLAQCDLTIDQVDELAVVEEEGAFGTSTSDEAVEASMLPTAWRVRLTTVPVRRVEPAAAAAMQAVLTAAGDTAVLVFDDRPAALAAFVRANGHVRPLAVASGIDRLLCAARTLACAAGVPSATPFLALDRLASQGEPEFEAELADAIRWRAPFGVVVDHDRIVALGQRLSDGGGSPSAASVLFNVKLQQLRSALAASFIERVAQVVVCAAEYVREAAPASEIVLGGALFASTRLNTSVARLLGGGISIAPVPEAAGLAIGAAAGCHGAGTIGGLALGPSFSESDIKAILDNCRLDYVYEPDWRRLLTRLSKMLSRGMVVGWFQGPMVFGPRSLGTRSVLCDPSTRYARENVNEYLKRLPLDAPLPVSCLPQRADECLATATRSPFMLLDAGVRSAWRDRVRAALDHRHEVRIHTVTSDQSPELVELLEVHAERSGVPGLINTNLSGPGEPTACTPRDAVRTVYSSAIDALVIGRFLLMKDYWLLRSDAS